jgi:hypothetical protein
VAQQRDTAKDLVAGFGEAAGGNPCELVKELLHIGAGEHHFIEMLSN